MHLENVLNEWEKDSIIKPNLSDASMEAAKMHSKYLGFFFQAKTSLKKTESEKKVLLKDKWLYYDGKMSKEEMDKRGWAYDPFDGLLIKTKSQKEIIISADTDLLAMDEKIEYLKVAVEILENILENIKWRNQAIRNALEYEKFKQGY